jgi:hypothetical protein
MSILPGLRDLRTPLATGYVWLGCCWLLAAASGWQFPLERPTEGGFLRDAYDLAAAFGSVPLIGALSFLAYVLGSFVEISTDSRLATLSATSWRSIYRSPGYEISATTPGARAVARDVSEMRARLVNSLSPRALRDLNRHIDAAQAGSTVEPPWTTDRDSASRIRLAHDVLEELPQLATRLLVKNPELYARYDRLLAEAAFRLNIALPLSVLAWLLTVTLSDTGRQEIYVSAVIAVAGAILLRQGSMRAVRARDTVVQALTIEDLGLNSRSLEENLSHGAGLYSEIRKMPSSSLRIPELATVVRVSTLTVLMTGPAIVLPQLSLAEADAMFSILGTVVGMLGLVLFGGEFIRARRRQSKEDAINKAYEDVLKSQWRQMQRAEDRDSP